MPIIYGLSFNKLSTSQVQLKTSSISLELDCTYFKCINCEINCFIKFSKLHLDYVTYDWNNRENWFLIE